MAFPDVGDSGVAGADGMAGDQAAARLTFGEFSTTNQHWSSTVIDPHTNQLVCRGYDTQTIDFDKSERTIHKSVENLAKRFNTTSTSRRRRSGDAVTGLFKRSLILSPDDSDCEPMVKMRIRVWVA